MYQVQWKTNKRIVRTESFWIDLWLQANYKGIVTRYIIHDTVAKLVDRDTFFRTVKAAGQLSHLLIKLCSHLIDKEFLRLTGIYIHFIFQMEITGLKKIMKNVSSFLKKNSSTGKSLLLWSGRKQIWERKIF